MAKRAQQTTRDEQAARLVANVIRCGLVVKASGSCPSGDFTVGPYHRAVGPEGFALFGYGRSVPEPYQAREATEAITVARLFVSAVGSTRAREAAMATPNRPPFSDAAAQIARKRGEHIRLCRAFHCRECQA